MKKSDFGYYDGLRHQLAQEQLDVNRSDVFTVTVEDGSINTTYDLRHIVSFLGVTSSISQERIDTAAAAFLAIHHVNNKDATIVPEISTALNNCNIKFTLEVIDSKHSSFVVSESFTLDVARRREINVDLEKPFPTAILGESSSSVSSTLGILTGVHDVPQIPPSSTSIDFDNKNKFPLVARLIPSDAADAKVALDYLANKLNITHCGILYVRNSYGLSFFHSFEIEAIKADPPISIVSSSIPSYPTEEEISRAIEQLKDSGLRYFFGVIYSRHFEPVMTKAYDEGIVGKGYFWMFSEGIPRMEELLNQIDTSSDVVDASHGLAQIKIANDQQIFRRREGMKSFMLSWKRTVSSPEMLQYLKEKVPGNMTEWRPSDKPSHYTMNAYDSVVAMALASCGAKNNVKQSFFGGRDFYKALLNVQFQGAFGKAAFDKENGGRRWLNLPYAVKNLLLNGDSKNRTFSFEITDIYEQRRDRSGVMEWKSTSPFEFSDGTTNLPDILPPINITYETITTPALIIGYVLCGLTIGLSIFFCLWSIRHRKSKVVRKSQPFFLIMLCAGTTILGSAIIPLSFNDPSKNINLGAACQSVTWLFSTGFIITFSALFSKTKRVYQILYHASHRRLTVMPVDVIKPFIFLFSLNSALLAAWTALDPMEYEIVYTDRSFDQFGRPLKSWGICSTGSIGNALQFLIIALDAVVLLYANFIAYKARDIATEYSESHCIRLSMASILQVVLIGVPILIVSRDIPTASFLVISFVVSTIGISVLVLIFCPKMYFLREWKQEQRAKAARREEKRRRNSAFLKRLGDIGTSPSSVWTDSSRYDIAGLRVTPTPEKTTHLLLPPDD